MPQLIEKSKGSAGLNDNLFLYVSKGKYEVKLPDSYQIIHMALWIFSGINIAL